MLHRQPAGQSAKHQDNRTGIAATLLTGQQLQGVPLEFHGVAPGHSSAMLEAQDMLQA